MSGVPDWCGTHGGPSDACNGPHGQYMAPSGDVITMPLRNGQEVAAYQEVAARSAFISQVQPGIFQNFAGILVALTAHLSSEEAFALMYEQLERLKAEFGKATTTEDGNDGD